MSRGTHTKLTLTLTSPNPTPTTRRRTSFIEQALHPSSPALNSSLPPLSDASAPMPTRPARGSTAGSNGRSTRRSEAVGELNGLSVGEVADSMSRAVGRPSRAKRGKVQDDEEEDEYEGTEEEEAEGTEEDAEGSEDEAEAEPTPPPPRKGRASKAVESDADGDFQMDDAEPNAEAQTDYAPEPESKPLRFIPKRKAKPTIADSEEDDIAEDKPQLIAAKTRSGRSTTRPVAYPSDVDSEEERRQKKPGKLRRGRKEEDYAVSESSGSEDQFGNKKKARRRESPFFPYEWLPRACVPAPSLRLVGRIQDSRRDGVVAQSQACDTTADHSLLPPLSTQPRRRLR